MCKALERARNGGRDVCSLGRTKTDSFIHSSSRPAGRQVEKLFWEIDVLVEKMEDGRISWYPWSVQITVTKLAVARVGPSGLEGVCVGVGRMLKTKKNQKNERK